MEAEIIALVKQNPVAVYLLVFGVLLACGLGVPIPEDITLVAGGYTVYLAEQNQLGQPALIPMIIVGMVGVLSGDMILFFTGRWLGPKVTKVWPFRMMVSEERLEKVHGYFAKHGVWTAFFARFAAGLRAPCYLLAGTARMRFRTFFLADGTAALLSVPLLIFLAWRFGDQIDRVKVWLSNSKYAVGAVLLVVVIIIVVKVIKGRRARAAAARKAIHNDSADDPAEPEEPQDATEN